MKRKSVKEKKQELEAFCNSRKCDQCPLILTEYCQENDTSPEQISKAYKIMNNPPLLLQNVD